MTEDEIVEGLCSDLETGRGSAERLNKINIFNSTSDARSLGDLVGEQDFDLFKDDSRWNTHPKFMENIAGGVRPDVVIRSKNGQNRILIEAKCGTGLREIYASQVVRYLLHLLCTSLKTPNDNRVSIRRAILMAAPDEWFAKKKNADAWGHFVSTYTPLATAFRVTIGEIRWKG